MKQKQGAIEMSIGTIVTIVLSVSFLILGIFLIKQISNISTNVVDQTDAQLRTELDKLFSETSRVVILPQTTTIPIKQEEANGVVIGIKNLQTGTNAGTSFSYNVAAEEVTDCGVSKTVAESWIATGKTGSNIQIPIGESSIGKVIFRIPTGSPLCLATYRVTVNVGSTIYKSVPFVIEVKAK